MVEIHVGGDMSYCGATVQERGMKVQEVILRAMTMEYRWNFHPLSQWAAVYTQNAD